MDTSGRLLTLTLAAALLAPGCRSLGTGAGTGAVIGSALGAGAGYAIGEHNDDKWAGTALGALAGGVAGWMIGDAVAPATRERPIHGPPVHRVDHSPAPRMDADRPYRGATTERVIIRDIYPDGSVRERTVPLD